MDLEWNDVGSWESIFEVLPGDSQGNIVIGCEHLGPETTGSLIYGTQPKRLVVTIGVQDLVIVDTGDVLLICRRERSQQVRQVVEHLRNNDQKFL